METYYHGRSLNLPTVNSARERAETVLKTVIICLAFIKNHSPGKVGYWSPDDNGYPADITLFGYSMYHMIRSGAGAGLFLPVKGSGGEHAVFYAVSGATLTGTPAPSGDKMNFYYDGAGESGPLRAPILPASVGFLYSATNLIPIPRNPSGNQSFRIPKNTLVCPIDGCGWNKSETALAGLIASYQTPFTGYLRLGVSKGVIAALFAPKFSEDTSGSPNKITVAGPICMPMPWTPDKSIRQAVAFVPGSQDTEDFNSANPALTDAVVDFPLSDGGLAINTGRYASYMDPSAYVAGTRVPWAGIYLTSPVDTGDGTGLYGYINPEVLRFCGVSERVGRAGRWLNSGKMIIPNTNSPANFSIMWEDGLPWY